MVIQDKWYAYHKINKETDINFLVDQIQNGHPRLISAYHKINEETDFSSLFDQLQDGHPWLISAYLEINGKNRYQFLH